MTEDDLSAIRVDGFLPHPPAKVWRALTDPDLLARWLMPNDFKPVVGHRFTFTRPPMPAVRFAGTAQCEVLEIEPERRLKISWVDPGEDNALDSTVTWRLVPEGRGTRLFIDHEGFDPDNPHQQLSRRIMGDQGWRGTLDRIASLIDTASTADPVRRYRVHAGAVLFVLAWWGFANAYEAIVLVPGLLRLPTGSLAAELELGSPVYYFIPAGPTIIILLWTLVVRMARDRDGALRTVLAAAVAAMGGVAATVVAVVLVNPTFRDPTIPRAELGRAVLAWELVNGVRLALLLTAAVLLLRWRIRLVDDVLAGSAVEGRPER